MSVQLLEDSLRSKKATIGLIGLGYVGLPLARAFLAAGFRTFGFDVDPGKIAYLSAGKSYIAHVAGDWIADAIERGRFVPTARMDGLGEPDALLICVPTPLTESRDPDLQYVRATAEQIVAALRPGQLIVLESTTYPGTTREVVLHILEKSGLKLGKDFFLAYSPEREDPGNQQFTTASIPKLVGGVDEESGRLAELSSTAKCSRPLSACRTAK